MVKVIGIVHNYISLRKGEGKFFFVFLLICDCLRFFIAFYRLSLDLDLTVLYCVNWVLSVKKHWVLFDEKKYQLYWSNKSPSFDQNSQKLEIQNREKFLERMINQHSTVHFFFFLETSVKYLCVGDFHASCFLRIWPM